MKVTKQLVILGFFLAFSMLLTTSVVVASNARSETAVDGMPAPLVAFEGLFRAQADPLWGDPVLGVDSQVPDTSGDAGMTRYIQAVNESVAMYTKTGTLIIWDYFENFWNGAGTGTACDGTGDIVNSTHHGQPNVLYDHMAQRWVIMDLAYADVDDGPYYLCIAVSNYTVGEAPPDFTPASWLYYALPAQNQWPYYLPNQARIGLWPDGYYIAADMYDIYNNGLNRTAEGSKVWAVNREDLSNNATEWRAQSFYLTEEDYSYHGLLPSNLEGDPPSTGTPNFFVGIAPPNQFLIWKFSVDWTNSSASTFTFEPTVLTIADPFEWNVGYLVDQPDTTEMLDIHSDRLSSVSYRIVNGVEALWASHTVVAGTGEDDIRWYEVRNLSNTPYFYQQGSFAPDTDYRWISSLGVDGMGNMAIGYSISGPDQYPSVYYTGRLASDPLGTLPQGEMVLREGTGFQDMNPLTNEGPWGERSAMSVDPVDPCVFWYTNEYYQLDEPTNWYTVIGAFRFPGCMQGTTTRISLHTNGTQGNGASGIEFEGYSVAISDDGRYVAFASEASNLVDYDTNGKRDIFLRDRDVDEDGVFDESAFVSTTRISMTRFGTQTTADSWQVAISGDGRYVAFASFDSNLVVGDTNGFQDVFRYDRLTGTIIRVSVSSAGVQGNNISDQPSISYDGRYVAFRSYANNLVDGDANDPSDIFVRDVGTSTTTMVSVSSLGEQGDADSYSPSISNDGQWVAFASQATNLYPGDNNFLCDYNGDGIPAENCSDVFIYDRSTGDLYLVSAQDGTADVFGDNESYGPSVSADGNKVAFVSRATNLIPNFIDDNNAADIFLRNVAYMTTRIISTSYFGAPANADSYTPAISPDATYIAFASDASTLDLYTDMNGVRDIFLHDIIGGLTRMISHAFNGGASNGRSVAPDISEMGSHVAYPSFAKNLVTNDTNNEWDVFAYYRLGIIPTFLSIPSSVPGYPGEDVDVPVVFTSHDYNVDSTTFSVDFDEACLIYNSTTFSLPGTFVFSASYSPLDTDGELDFAIHSNTDTYPPIPLEDGTLLTMHFTVKTSCQADPNGTRSVHVGFSTDPRASFGDNGQSVPGATSDGSVIVYGGYLGDCNNDGLVNAGDLTAMVLEIFDGDGNVPADVPGGTFAGNPVGCNPNQDLVVDAGDISCEVMVIFDSNAACATSLSMLEVDSLFSITSEEANASLSIAADYPGPATSQVNLPITLASNGNLVNSLVFSVDYDRTWLSYETVSFNVPDGFTTEASEGLDGQINFVIYGAVGLTVPDGVIATITLTVGQPDQTSLSPVFYFYQPPVSLGSTTGESLPVIAEDGSIWTFSWVSRNLLPLLVKP